MKTIPGSETTVEVQIPVVFADTKHSRVRQGERELPTEEAIALVNTVLPKVLDAVAKDKVTKTTAGDPYFCVVDKQSCAVVVCTIESDKTLKQKVLIRTVFFRDQYHPLSTGKTIFYVNENNPSKEWEEIERYSGMYDTDIHRAYREYEMQFDSEHPESRPYRNKEAEMEQMWAMREPEPELPNRLGKNYGLAKHEADVQLSKTRSKNGMGVPEYNLKDAMNAADKRILTKRGPNGTLRGIDRRRKAAERRLNEIVEEVIKQYKENLRG